MEAPGPSEMVLTTYHIHGVSKRTLRNYLPRKDHRFPAYTLNFYVLTCEFKNVRIKECIGTKFCILKAVKVVSVSRQLAKVKALVYC
jgi:hypothetical protein